jgi:hypothetical protein
MGARASRRAASPPAAGGAFLGARDLEALRRAVEDYRAHVHRRDVVYERVVHLRDEGGAATPEPLDERELPQRARAVERLGQDLADELAELRVTRRLRQRHPPRWRATSSESSSTHTGSRARPDRARASSCSAV